MLRINVMEIKIIKVLIIAAAIPVLVLSLQEKQPFCRICECRHRNISGTDSPDVICTKDQRMHILNNLTWTNNKTNISYAYNSIHFENQKFINLTYVFPPSNLTYANLASNDIYNLGKAVFKNWRNMRTLILSHNDLEVIDPDAFEGYYKEHELKPLDSLRELRLDRNRISSLNQDLFEHTTHIEILDLSDNPLQDLDRHTVSAIGQLILLKELYLQYTGIKTLPANFLHTLKNLAILDLSGNPFNVLPETLSQAQNLNTLYLNNTGFIDISDHNGFPVMPNLKVLHLCRNQYLSQLQAHGLSGLTGLEDLRLSDNIELTYIDPKALAKPLNNSGGSIWPPIKKLYIENNKISYIDSDIIARWDGLSELDIKNNPWICDCENQWLIDDLMPIYLKIEESMAKEVRCAAPIEMVKYSFHDLYIKKSNMRCLDAFNAHPENDAAMLVGVLAGVLIAIPLILLAIMAYQRKWISICGICDDSPASYSRRFYKASATDDNF